METIRIPGDVNATLVRVSELKTAGLIQDVDFTWRFTPYSYDYITNETTDPSCEFTFTNDSYASLYVLRWR